jgi:hypothetical protein
LVDHGGLCRVTGLLLTLVDNGLLVGGQGISGRHGSALGGGVGGRGGLDEALGEELRDISASDGVQAEGYVDVKQGQSGGHGLHAHSRQVDAVQAARTAVEDDVLGQGPGHGVVQHAGVS